MKEFSRLVLATWLLMLVQNSRGEDGSELTKWQARHPLARINFDIACGAIVVPVQIDGKEYHFIVDTGCGVTIFDERLSHLAEKSSRTLTAITLSDRRVVARYRPLKQLQLGGAEMQKEADVIVSDLSIMSEAFGHDVSGVLGYDRLREFVVHINCDDGILEVLRNLDDEKQPPGRKMKLKVRKGVPAIEGTCGGVARDMTLDTGLLGTAILNREAFSQMVTAKYLDLISDARPLSDVDGKVRFIPMARCNSIRFGDLVFDKPVCYSEPKLDAIGINVIAKMVVTLDSPNLSAFIAGGKNINAPDHSDFDGLELDHDESDEWIAVREVMAGSVADRCGVKKGDRIVSVGKSKVANMGFGRFLMQFNVFRNGELPITVMRDGKECHLLLGR